MEVYFELPTLRSLHLNQDVPKFIQSQLSYEWKACHHVCKTSPQLSLALSRSFISTCRDYAIDIPDEVKTRFCINCNMLMLPSITSSLSVVRKTNKNARKFSNAASEKVKNQMVITCLLCRRTHHKTPGFKKQNRSRKESSEHAPRIPDAEIMARVTPKKKFSFADTLHAGAGKANPLAKSGQEADFIPLGPPSNTSMTKSVGNSAGGYASKKSKAAPGTPTWRLSLESKTQTPTSATSATSTSQSSESGSTTKNPKINLLDLERSNKKKKRKSGDIMPLSNTNVSQGSKRPSTGSSAHSLSGLQAMFKGNLSK